jgi:plasmid replication initiation protein
MTQIIKEKDAKTYKERLEQAKLLIQDDNLRKEVIISNSLARESSRYTLEEEKMAHYIFAHLNPYGENDTKIVLSKKKIINIFGGSSKSTYDTLKWRMKGMMMKSILSFKDDKTTLMGVLITLVKWVEGTDVVEITLNEGFMPYLQNLSSYYTRLDWKSIIAFNSKHALSLYKYLSSWASDNEVTIASFTTKDLKKLFDLDKNDYMYNKKFMRHLFEKKVVDVAVNEINERAPGMRVTWQKTKKGNTVLGYVFEFLRVTE